VAALGGLIAPAALYLALIHGPTGVLRGWSVGEATDVSVALAVLAVAGPRLPPSLRILLMGVAIVDDLADVGLTAVLHTAPLRPGMLAGAGVVVAALAFLSRWRRAPFLFYAVGFALTWGFVLKSGLSTALAGIACAFTVPIGAHRPGQDSMLKYFMDSLHPYVAYAILPLFAFTSAGFSLRDIAPGDLIGAPPMGVILALWIGKPLGVFGLAWAASALKLVRRPSGADWVEVLGAAMLCGVGFTVSLFLVALTSPVGTDRDEAGLRLAVAAGSALSGLSGAALLSWAQRRRSERGEDVLD
jgi:NhaA family Na+:H+ antiporter